MKIGKKIWLLLLSGAIALSLAACSSDKPENKDTDKPDSSASDTTVDTSNDVVETAPDTLDVSKLSEYTIVYPSAYEDWQMTEVTLLQNVIEHLTGTKIEAVADTDATETDKEIIFASSTRTTSIDAEVEALPTRMDYMLALDGWKVILGGQNYYSDMRAAYDFINNYLGYDDLTDVYGDATKTLSGKTTEIFAWPEFYIGGHFAHYNAITEPWMIRDIADCGINVFMEGSDNDFRGTDEQYLQQFAMCARFGVLVYAHTHAVYENDTVIASVRLAEQMGQNPAVLGHYVQDEPGENDLVDSDKYIRDYKEKYGETYGWKAYINHLASGVVYDKLEANPDWLSAADTMCFDYYFRDNMTTAGRSGSPVMEYYSRMRNITKTRGQDFWTYIECYQLNQKPDINTSKSFRYVINLGLCFGVEGVNYFLYNDPDFTVEGDWVGGELVNRDFSKNQAWYDAQATNRDLMKTYELYKQYNHLGAFVVNPGNMAFAKFDNPYDFSDVLVNVLDNETMSAPKGRNDQYLIGCMEAKEGDGHAFILMNLRALDAVPYYETEADKVLNLEINGENVHFYLDGEEVAVEKDENGHYLLGIGKGQAFFVTVD